MRQAKPFLRWAGSKRKQLDILSAFWLPHHKRYIEPFCGSACLFFKLAPERAILGDNNEQLIELYRVIRDDPERLYRRLRSLKRDLPTYTRWRAKKPEQLDVETRALRFLYLNRNCFNGIYRTNLQGQFNVPMGKKLSPYLNLDELVYCSHLLQKTRFVAGDFIKTIKDARKDDFVYMDPPYATTGSRIFTEYGNKPFSSTDIPRFSDSLTHLDKVGANFIVSYADCEEARVIAQTWKYFKFPVRRSIAGFANSRKMTCEWLVTNMDIPPSLEHLNQERTYA